MINDEEDILRYLNRQMNDEERMLFEKRLDDESSLREELKHSQRMKSILDQETQQFAREVRSVIETKRGGQRFGYFWVAASITLLLVVGAYLFWPSTSQQNLATEFLEPYPDIITSRSTDEMVDMNPYNKADYPNAILIFEPLAEEDLRIQLYLGVSYLMVDREEEAYLLLNEANYNNTQFEADFRWYVGLAALKLGRTEEAKSTFQALRDDSNYYRKKATEILDDLD
ncbi:MAG: hypothetical protein AAF391_00805 [Bacteroidota bacterium]